MARIACSPLTWSGALDEYFLDDAAGAGYAGVEANAPAVDAFARQPGRLRGLLEERRLTLAAVPFTGTYFEREAWPEEQERLRRVADFVAEVAGQGIVVFASVPHPARRDMIAGQRPLLPLDASRMGRLAETLNRYCDVCAGFGLTGAVANRVGSYVETADEYEALLERTELGLVWLAPDLGHWAYAGGDPVALLRTHESRIAYPRLKDFDQALFDRTVEAHLGFASFVRAGGFKELGAGSLDLGQALQPLLTHDYGGWLGVELEITEKTPRESAQISREYLRERFHW